MRISREEFTIRLVDTALMTEAELAEFLIAVERGGFGDVQQDDGTAEWLAGILQELGALTQYQVNRLFDGDTAGLVLGEFEILSPIGKGGVGEVFKARRRGSDQFSAVKILRTDVVSSESSHKRFHQEIKVALELNHPHIVRAVEAGENGGILYLVMELLEGTDLAALIENHGRLTVWKSTDYIRQAAIGLEYAHRRGIVHRDIKPSNLFLDTKGVVKILDLGLASFRCAAGASDTTTSRRLTQTGQLIGTCDFMAPEQAEDARQADERADIYSLGCTLYWLLIGEPVFPRNTPMQSILTPFHRLCDEHPIYNEARIKAVAHLARRARKHRAAERHVRVAASSDR